MEEEEKINYRKRIELYILSLSNQIAHAKKCIEQSAMETNIEVQKIKLCEEAIELSKKSFKDFAGEEL